MSRRTLLLGDDEANRAGCVPRMTAGKKGEGLVMVLMWGKQVVVRVAAAVAAAAVVGGPM